MKNDSICPRCLLIESQAREKGVRIGIGQHIIYDTSRQAGTLDMRCVFQSANVSKSEFEVSLPGRAIKSRAIPVTWLTTYSGDIGNTFGLKPACFRDRSSRVHTAGS
jgi:hypothetical protein